MAWQSWKCYPMVTDAFLFIRNHPFHTVGVHAEHFRQLERFTIILYDKTSTDDDVNEARRELFSKKNRNLENIPPTQVLIISFIPYCIVHFLLSYWLDTSEDYEVHMEYSSVLVNVNFVYFSRQDALLQHTKRVILQAGIWTTSLESQPTVPGPNDWLDNAVRLLGTIVDDNS